MPILCNGGFLSDEMQIQITQTTPAIFASCVVGSYFGATFVSFYSSNQSAGSQFNLTGFFPNTDYYVRIVDSTSYFNSNPNGNGISNTGVFSEVGPINFLEPPALIADPTSKTDITCNGLNDGTATVVNPSGGTPYTAGSPYTYLWDDASAQTTQTATGLAPGTYTCTVLDSNSCPLVTTSVTIIDPSLITADPTSKLDITCNGLNDGTATVVNPSGGTPYALGSAYTYLWDDALAQTTQTATGLAPGTYTCTVTDTNSCFLVTTSVTIIDPSILIVDPTTHLDITCNGFDDGTASVINPSGGTPYTVGAPYTYLWDDASGQTNQIATGLAPGTYTCTVSDSNSCSVATTSVTIVDPSSIVVGAITNLDITCNGLNDGTATIVNLAGGTPYTVGAPYTYLWDDASGQTTQTATGLGPGTYTCTVTDSNSCSLVTTSVTIIDPSVLIADPTTKVDITCNGFNDGSATVVNPSGGTPYTVGSAYTYLWDDASGQTTQTATGLAPGAYTCTVLDSNSCPLVTTSVTIIDPSLLIADTAHINVSCYGLSDGAAIVTPSGGTPYTAGSPYTYLWSPGGQTDSIITGLLPGTYFCTVTDSLGCSVITFPVEVTQPASGISIDSISTTDISCNGLNDGSATLVNPNGGTPFLIGDPYTYLWSPGGQNTQTAVGLSAGIYTCTITDATGGCPFIDSITITDPPQIEIDTIILDEITCFGDCDASIQSIQVSGGTPYTVGYDYLYSVNGGQPHPNTSYFNGYCPGTYTVQASDANNCFTSTYLIINQPVVLDVDITTSLWNNYQIRCNGDNSGVANILISGGTSPYSSNYYFSGNPTPIAASPIVSGLTAGIYTFEVIDNHGCTYLETITYSEPDTIQHHFIATHVTCNAWNNGSLTDSVYGGVGNANTYTYLWNNNATTHTINNIGTGQYYIEVRDQNNCLSVDTFNINDDNALSATISAVNVSCYDYCDGAITVDASGGIPNINANGDSIYNYLWNDTLFQTTQTATGLCVNNTTLSTIYECVITDMQGCTIILSETLVQPTQLVVTAEINNEVLCFNGLTGGLSCSVTGGTPTYSYMWSNNSPNYSANPSNNGVSAGDYVITVMDAEGCVAADFITLAQPTELSLNITNNDVTCFGFNNGIITATAQNGTPFLGIPPSYLYSVTNEESGIIVYSETLPVGLAENLIPGIYTITAEDMNGCTIESGTIYVSEPGDSLSIIFNSVDASCLQNNGSCTIDVDGGTPLYQYNWDDGATTTVRNGLAAGYYPITVTDSRGCEIRDSAFVKGTHNVFADSLSEITFNICLGDSVLININETPLNTYVWENGSTITDRWVYPEDYVNIYTLSITDPNCLAAYDVVATVNVEFINPMLGSEPGIEYGDFPVVLSGESIGLFSENNTCIEYMWQWDNNTITNSSGTTITIDDVKTSDWYYLYVKDDNGCLGYDSVYIVVGVKPYEAITPNNDGFNDTWTPLDIESYENSMVQVFNRWGGVVFESKGGENYQPWDGTKNGEELVVGTYYYIIDLNNGDEPQTGPVTIIR